MGRPGPRPTGWCGFPAGNDRTVLSIAAPKPPTCSELDARNAKPPAWFEAKAPRIAPNVVIVLVDAADENTEGTQL
jgi:hypothetical protein